MVLVRMIRVSAPRVSLGKSVCGLWTWVEAHVKDVERSRRAFDAGAPPRVPLAKR
jgi:hypothetical protein